MGVRCAVQGDVAGIARVHVDSWEGAYRGVVPDSVFDVVNLDFRLGRWAQYFDSQPAATAVLVAEDGTQIVGMASSGPCRDEDIPQPTAGELHAMYVDPNHWGEGHGRDLMVKSLEEMRDLGYDAASLWVLDANRRGRRFYESGGWAADGSVKVDDSFGPPLTHVRYRLSL